MLYISIKEIPPNGLFHVRVFFTQSNKIIYFVSLISTQCFVLRGVKLSFIEITFVHQKHLDISPNVLVKLVTN